MKFLNAFFVLALVFMFLTLNAEAVTKKIKTTTPMTGVRKGTLLGGKIGRLCSNDDQCYKGLYCKLYTTLPNGECQPYCKTGDDCEPNEFCNFDRKCLQI